MTSFTGLSNTSQTLSDFGFQFAAHVQFGSMAMIDCTRATGSAGLSLGIGVAFKSMSA
jgi:hypothetical protein